MSEGGILRWTIAIVLAMCLTSGGSASAGDMSAIPKVGALVRPQVNAPYEAGLRDGLRELGYIEGKNISIEWRRSAGGDQDALLAADLVRSNLDIVVVFSTSELFQSADAEVRYVVQALDRFFPNCTVNGLD